ncbi:proline-rich protein 5-like [Oppia nitens]|uniref:proline-rich protein 5-like n=1 Tax=Oppia nitens TaxID=1686743 RepID=UPI0023DA97C2|nr:proline-rich protein 5-like [Oppia nitens]
MSKNKTSLSNIKNWRHLRKSVDATNTSVDSTANNNNNNSSNEVKARTQRSNSQKRLTFSPFEDISPEYNRTICLGNISVVSSGVSISQAHDWLGLENTVIQVFEGSGVVLLNANQLSDVHRNVKNLLDSNIGSFVYDRYKSQMLKKGMTLLKERVNLMTNLMDGLSNIWIHFYTNILPTLDAILYRVKPKCGLTVRQTTLIEFRDEVIFETHFENKLKELVTENKIIPTDIKQMLLVLQSICECFPPSKNKIHIESLTALAISPYMAYKGLYVNYNISEPTVPSREPHLNAKRKSIDLLARSLSRPLTMQPKQLETLNELFASAIGRK